MISYSCSLLSYQYQISGIVWPRTRISFLNNASPKPRQFSGHRSVQRFNFVQSQVNSHGSLKSLICYDKSIPEEVIEKPVGLSLNRREIGVNSACINCQAKGAILCDTCSGSGLYVESILESQGIIVKVRCLGCGGSGNIMCTTCGGRGHTGHY